MTQPDFSATLLYARMQGRHAMQRIAEDHLPLVGAMVRRFPHHGREPEELYQQGCIGLMKALARFDPERGVAFSTYAAAMILGEMRTFCRNDTPVHIPRPEREARTRIRRAIDQLTAHLGREPTMAELSSLLRMDAAELALMMEDVTVTSCDAETEGGTPFLDSLPDPDDWQRRLELRDAFSRLPEADRRLLFLRHGEGLSQQETARRLGMTQMQISRRESVIRSLLRKMLE